MIPSIRRIQFEYGSVASREFKFQVLQQPWQDVFDLVLDVVSCFDGNYTGVSDGKDRSTLSPAHECQGAHRCRSVLREWLLWSRTREGKRG